jgi:signal transduction histidine kinase
VKAGPSLRLRSLVGAVLWSGLALATSAWVLVTLFRDHVVAQAESGLIADMEQLLAMLEVAPDGTLRLRQELSEPRFRQPYSGLYWQVDAADRAMLRSRSLWDYALPLPPDEPAIGELHRHRLPGPREEPLLTVERRITLPNRDDPLRVAVALDAREPERAVAVFTHSLFLSFTLLGGVLVLAAVGQAVLVFRPLTRLRRRLADVRDGRATRLDGPFPAEIQSLANELNDVLDHNAALVERARNQAGDLAHGLKTPLAIFAAVADALAASDRHEQAMLLHEQIDIMRRQINTHLARVRAAAARDLPGIRALLLPCIETLARALSRLHRVDIDIRVPPDLVFRGEARDLQEMLGNLMDNAGKWAASKVRVSAARTGDRLWITVDDDGPGLAADRREEVFARFHRLDEAVPGTGLGLAITRELVEIYGGAIDLVDSPLGGLRARLTLPAVPETT